MYQAAHELPPARTVTFFYDACPHKETIQTPGVADPAGVYWEEGENLFPGVKEFGLSVGGKCSVCEPKIRAKHHSGGIQ